MKVLNGSTTEKVNGKVNGAIQRVNHPVTIVSEARVPPQSLDLERAVLGAIMLEREAITKVIDLLRPETFYHDRHQRIFNSCLRLSHSFKPIDILTVIEDLKKHNELNAVGGPCEVTSITRDVCNSVSIEYHAELIHQKYILRESIKIGANLVGDSFAGFANASELIEKASNDLYCLTKGMYKKDFSTPEEMAMEITVDIDNKMTKEKGTLTGVPSGFKPLDFITCGWQKTDLIILAARPGEGKTAIALNMALNAGVPVGFFSMEMSRIQLLQRLISIISEVELSKIRSGDLNQVEYQQAQKAIQTLQTKKIYIDDSSALTVMQMRAKARRLKDLHGIQLFIGDYLQLMTPSESSRNKSTNDQIKEISGGLKALAKDFEIPFIALSQLTRGIEKRDGEKDKTPKLSDLRDGGSIEQDADIVCFLYGGEKPVLRISKHRNGCLGVFGLVKQMTIQKITAGLGEPLRPKTTKEKAEQFDENVEEVQDEITTFNKQKK